MQLFYFATVAAVICLAAAAPVKDVEKEAQKWLTQFGYAKEDEFTDADPEVFSETLKVMQKFAHIEQTGKLDAATLKVMATPRCGLRDVTVSNGSKRKRRFAKQGSWWNKNKLTWRLENGGRLLSKEVVRKVFHRATQFWSKVTNMDFEEIFEGTADIMVRFDRYFHGDPYPFDGPNGVLAHAFYPEQNTGINGDVHFDDDEDFTYQSDYGRDLLWTTVHELGHSLGLEHSTVKDAIMAPYYPESAEGLRLSADDILGIQSIYGARQNRGPTTTTTVAPTTQKIPQDCKHVKAVYDNKALKSKLVFLENQKFMLIRNPEDGGRYGVVSNDVYFPSLKSKKIDAVGEFNANGRHQEVFFTGSTYHIYESIKHVSGPHQIRGDNPLNIMLPASVNRIDAAAYWKPLDITYLFAGKKFWRYDNKKMEFERGYPKVIADSWKGLPDEVDAAYPDDNGIYFVKDQSTYFYDFSKLMVPSGYPKLIDKSWHICHPVDKANEAP